MAAEAPDISEEILLGRTLLEQGHLGTAQRVLVKICQTHPDNAEAVRGLSELLHRKGDDTRARIMGDYAKDLSEPLSKNRHPTSAKPGAKPGAKPPPMPPPPLPVQPPAGSGKPQPTDEAGMPHVAPPGPPATMPQAPRAALNPLRAGESDMPMVAPGPPATMPQTGVAPTPASGATTTLPQSAAPQPADLQISIANVPLPPVTSEPSQPSSVAAVATTPTKAPGATPHKKSSKGKVVALLSLLGLLGGGGVYGYRLWQEQQRQQQQNPSFSAREELDHALASGSLARMMRVREKVRAALAVPKPEPGGLLRLALVDAVLALDYGVASAKSAEESLGKVPAADPNEPQHQALVETVRGVLSLDAGDRSAARQHAQAGLAKAGSQPPPLLLLLSARLHYLSGDMKGAGQELARAMSAAPEFAPAVADWGLLQVDAGDPSSARRVLQEFLGKNRSATRVQLAAAEAERALGEGAWKRHVKIACRGDTRAARGLRAACTLAAAHDARLDGERASAIRKAKAATQGSDDARLLSDAAMVLASLGEVDSAGQLVDRARKRADDAAVPLAWAALAVRLGRGQLDGPPLPSDHPPLSERALLMLRAEYLKGGGPAMVGAVKNVAAGLPELDPDLRTYMYLAGQDGLPKSERPALERRADRGNPVAAFVLGVMAARENDHKLAAKRLEKAMSGHGDVCRAALLYLQALQAQDKPAQPNHNALRALRDRCSACPLPEI